MDAARYYADLTVQYERYAGASHGWHYGVWEDDVRSHTAALLRSNEVLLRGLDVTPATRILDVGFGIGGFAVWAARRFGAAVTGITVAEDHLAPARALAAAQGVSAHCEFQLMDMNELAFADRQFDVVVNQETFCHADDKAAYLAAVYRVLRPGGAWRAVDFSVREAPLDVPGRRSYDAVCAGFHLPSMAPASATANMLAQAGFDAIECHDLSPLVLKTATHILRACYLPLVMTRLGLDWTFRPRDARQRQNRQGHVSAAYHYSRGLRSGLFRHAFYAARKPPAARSDPSPAWTS